MREFFLYLLYRTGVAVIAALPLSAVFCAGQFFGLCGYWILPKYRRLAFHNATIAFGSEKSPRELKRLVRCHFQRIGANLLSGIKVAIMPLQKLESRMQIKNIDAIDRHLKQKRGVVLVLSHLGNWELISQILPKFIGHARNSTIYQRLGNRFIDAHVRRLRGRAGVEMFDRKDGFQKPIDLLREGGAIGILTDQHAGDQGLWVPFFGKLASTTSLPALLARRTRAALVGVAVYTTGVGRWRVVAQPLEAGSESVESLTAKATAMVAEQIRYAPEDWFWVHNRWKTPRPNFLLAHCKRGVYLPSGFTSQNLKPFRILVRASNWLGDSVMSVPAVRAIKTGRPDAHVTVAVPAGIAALWKLVPEVDEIVPLPGKSLPAAVRAIRRQPPFDVAIIFPNSLRSALEVWLSGVPRRAGYRGHWRRWLLNQIAREPRKPGPPKHQSFRYLRMAEICGAQIDQKTSNAQRPTPNAQLQVGYQPSTINHQPSRLALCPGAEYGPAKRWPPEQFAEAAAAIVEQAGTKWILFGTKNDMAIGGTIAGVLGENCINRIGQTSLEQLIDELRSCRLLLTNDTGTMHLAALLGIPVVAIFGSTEPRLTGPLGNHHIVLRHQVECSPCFLRECPIDFRCMKAVTVQEVVDAVLSMLAGGPA
jgi:lipopolysaccharide heptosyltransferase II